MDIEDQPALADRRLIARQAAGNAPYEQSLINGEYFVSSANRTGTYREFLRVFFTDDD